MTKEALQQICKDVTEELIVEYNSLFIRKVTEITDENGKMESNKISVELLLNAYRFTAHYIYNVLEKILVD